MRDRFWRSKWFIIALATLVLVPVLSLLVLRLDFGEREDAVLGYFSKQEGMPETFVQLNDETSADAVILCWWDYGRAVREWSSRDVIESYPSREIWHTVGASRDLWHNLEAQLFGTWGSNEKIHDIATMFMLPEEESLPLMKSYNVSHVLVFKPDELQKFSWIADIAGYNSTRYLTLQDDIFQLTAHSAQVTLLKLLFDDILNPRHFTRLFDNNRGKLFQVNYP